MDSVHFLNIEYFLVRVYELVTGIHVEVGSIPHIVLSLLGQVALLGMTASVIILALLVYFRIGMAFLEHAHAAHSEGGHDSHGGGHGHADVHAAAAHAAPVVHGHEAPPTATAAAHVPKNPRWDQVMALASSPQESDWRRAIMEADVLLDTLLIEQGYRGQTVGERLRDANPLQFTTLDLAWKAHKVRNDLAHGGEKTVLTERDTRATIDLYKRVFEEFDFI